MLELLSNHRTTAPSLAGVPVEFLSHLNCPYCGFKLEIDSEGARADRIVYGLLRCACYEYPVVDGIPILRQMEGLERVVRLIGGREFRWALLRTLDLFRTPWASQNQWRRLLHHWACSRVISGDDWTFDEAVHRLRRPAVFADYLVHRYANPSFLAAIGPLLLLKHTAGGNVHGDARILDLACGAGHASFLIGLLFPEFSVISADVDFVNLYLARRYMAPGGLQVCIDAQVPSPFPDDYYQAVYCQDAFHYIGSKKAAVRELKRVLRTDALWIFPHLHNRLSRNLVPGVPLSPEGYLKCFDLAGGRLFVESDLLQGLVREGSVDFSATASVARLNGAPALTFLRGGPELWSECRDFPSRFCERKDHLQVNPIYRRVSHGQSIELFWPNATLRAECAAAEAFLPQRCDLTAGQWEQFQRGDGAPEWLAEMVARFVLVPLPRSYYHSG